MYLTLSLPFIKETFKKYNTIYFNGELREPNFRITNTKARLGCCHHDNVCYGVRYGTIDVSKKYNRTEKEYINTILHEMIHLYIWQKDMKEPSGHRSHGVLFKHYASIINKDGWGISRCNEPSGGLAEIKESVEVMLCQVSDGRYFAAAMAKGCASKVARRYSGLRGVVFFKTKDAMFASMSRCRSRLCGKYITKKEYDSLVEANDCYQMLSIKRF